VETKKYRDYPPLTINNYILKRGQSLNILLMNVLFIKCAEMNFIISLSSLTFCYSASIANIILIATLSLVFMSNTNEFPILVQLDNNHFAKALATK
jgi:hypothetical protein